MLDLTWLEFEYISKGYEQKMQRNWDYVRNIMANQINSGGFSKKTVKPTDIMELPYIDNAKVTKVVERMSLDTIEAMKKHFKN